MRAIWIGLTVLLLGASLVDPPYPSQQPLQHAPTVVAIGLLGWASRRGPADTRADRYRRTRSGFYCGAAFLWLHILGARYIYTYVPYDEWSVMQFGVSINEWMGWSRNHYDRLVHFAFGVLCMPPSIRLAIDCGKMNRRWAMTFAVLVVLSVSAIYEVFEWGLTIVMSPKNAEAYNGQQGDYWDPQRDIGLAALGSLLVAVCMRAWKRDDAPQETSDLTSV